MYYVYVLKSDAHPEQIYTGFSSVEVSIRLSRHNSGSTRATRRYRPWSLAWYCAFNDKKMALRLEKYLKTGSGRAFLHKRLID